MNRQRPRATAEEIGWKIQIGNADRAADELKRGGVLLGVGATQTARRHGRCVVVVFDGHANRSVLHCAAITIVQGKR